MLKLLKNTRAQIWARRRVRLIKRFAYNDDGFVHYDSSYFDSFLDAFSDKNSIEKTKALIDAGVNVNTKDGRRNDWKDTPLMRVYTNTEIAKILINAGADVNATNKHGDTPLMKISKYGKTEIAKILIDAGANVNAKNNYGETPLMYAFENKDAEMVKLLIAAGANVNVNLAIKSPDFIEPALMYAVKNEDTETAKLLISAGADVNAKDIQYGGTALMYAVKNEDTEMVKLLIAAGADVNAKNKFDTTPLMFATYFRFNEELIKLLIAAGADVNAKNDDGQTALMSTLLHNPEPTANLLITDGNTRKEYGDAATLARTLKQIFTGSAKLLIAAGADVNTKDKWCKTPLMLAAQYGHPEITKLLIDTGADVNAKDHQGKTPLMHALDYRITETAKILIAAGADVNAKDENCKTPLDYAKTDEMKELLRKHGALSIIQINEQIKKQKNAPVFQFKLSETKKHLQSKQKNKSVSGVVVADKIAEMIRSGKIMGEVTPETGKKLRGQITKEIMMKSKQR